MPQVIRIGVILPFAVFPGPFQEWVVQTSSEVSAGERKKVGRMASLFGAIGKRLRIAFSPFASTNEHARPHTTSRRWVMRVEVDGIPDSVVELWICHALPFCLPNHWNRIARAALDWWEEWRLMVDSVWIVRWHDFETDDAYVTPAVQALATVCAALESREIAATSVCVIDANQDDGESARDQLSSLSEQLNSHVPLKSISDVVRLMDTSVDVILIDPSTLEPSFRELILRQVGTVERLNA